MFTFKNCLIAAGIVASWVPGVSLAHPFHISSAEIEYHVASDRLQISLKLQAVDMERALSKLAGKRIKLEQADVSQWLAIYLDRHFYLTTVKSVVDAGKTLEKPPTEKPPTEELADLSDAAGKSHPAAQTKSLVPRSRVHWVGSELKGAWMWLYFELELPPVRDDLQLVNTVLFDTNSGQINTVSVRHARQRTTLKLNSQQPSEKFPAQWMSP